jgi:hypothetical protein
LFRVTPFFRRLHQLVTFFMVIHGGLMVINLVSDVYSKVTK